MLRSWAPPPPMDKLEQQKVISEAFDSKRVLVTCGEHHYFGEGIPTPGCPNCWKVYYLRYFERVPPSQRRQRIEELYTLARHIVEEQAQGKWDLELFPHAKVNIEKDAA